MRALALLFLTVTVALASPTICPRCERNGITSRKVSGTQLVRFNGTGEETVTFECGCVWHSQKLKKDEPATIKMGKLKPGWSKPGTSTTIVWDGTSTLR